MCKNMLWSEWEGRREGGVGQGGAERMNKSAYDGIRHCRHSELQEMKSANTGAGSTKSLNAMLGRLDFILMALGGL